MARFLGLLLASSAMGARLSRNGGAPGIEVAIGAEEDSAHRLAVAKMLADSSSASSALAPEGAEADGSIAAGSANSTAESAVASAEVAQAAPVLALASSALQSSSGALESARTTSADYGFHDVRVGSIIPWSHNVAWRVEQEVHAGTFGVVYIASVLGCNSHFRGPIAMKYMRRSSRAKAEEFRDKVLLEVDYLSKMSGVKGFVRFLGHKLPSDSEAFIAMELADGDLIDFADAIPVGDFVIQFFSALVRMHEMGYAHRDIKLDNTLITKATSQRPAQVLIADLGYMCNFKGLDSAQPCKFDESGVGTTSYWPPELWLQGGRPLPDEAMAMDIWAAGIVLCSVLTNDDCQPFSAEAMRHYERNLKNDTLVNEAWLNTMDSTRKLLRKIQQEPFHSLLQATWAPTPQQRVQGFKHWFLSHGGAGWEDNFLNRRDEHGQLDWLEMCLQGNGWHDGYGYFHAPNWARGGQPIDDRHIRAGAYAGRHPHTSGFHGQRQEVRWWNMGSYANF